MVHTNMSESDDIINCTISHQIHLYLFSPVYILVLLVGVPSNLYSLYHAVLQLRQRNELGVYLLNLTVSDLLYLASLPLWLQYFFQDDDWSHREWVCQLCGFLLYENIYISIGFLCCISLDRYLAVVHPLRFTSLRSMRAAWLTSALIWLKEVAVGVVFFRHRVLSRDRTQHNQSVCFEHYPMQDWEYPINYYRFLVGFLFPLAILSVSYLCVLRAVGRSAGTQADQKTRIRHLVGSTILIFLVCFSPYHIFLLVRTLLERDCNFIAGIFNYYHLSLLLTSVNSLADPALYCFVSEAARRGLYRLLLRPLVNVFCCCRRRGNASPARRRPATDSHEVATPTDAPPSSVTLLTHLKMNADDANANPPSSVTLLTHLKMNADDATANANPPSSVTLLTHLKMNADDANANATANANPPSSVTLLTHLRMNVDDNPKPPKDECLVEMVERSGHTAATSERPSRLSKDALGLP